jgi:hypothetical protein
MVVRQRSWLGGGGGKDWGNEGGNGLTELKEGVEAMKADFRIGFSRGAQAPESGCAGTATPSRRISELKALGPFEAVVFSVVLFSFFLS